MITLLESLGTKLTIYGCPYLLTKNYNGYTLYKCRMKGQNAKEWKELTEDEREQWSQRAKKVREENSSS